jgi:hypothetical protein
MYINFDGLTLEVGSGHAALAGPVAAKSLVSKSLAVHGGDSTLGILLIRKDVYVTSTLDSTN